MSQPAAIAAALLVSFCSTAPALDIPAKHHAWGRFQPGSWARLRDTLSALDADGKEKVLSKTVTTTRLERVETDGVTLRREVSVDDGEPTVASVELGWDELPRDVERATRLGLGEIKIGSKTYVCQTHQVTTVDPSGAKTETKWFYCPDQSTYLLKKLARTEGSAARFMSFEVLELDVRRNVLGEERPAAKFSLIDNTPERSSRGSGYLADDVPGGLVEFDAELRVRGKEGLIQKLQVVLEAFEDAR
jgi:hypothetical protein